MASGVKIEGLAQDGEPAPAPEKRKVSYGKKAGGKPQKKSDTQTPSIPEASQALTVTEIASVELPSPEPEAAPIAKPTEKEDSGIKDDWDASESEAQIGESDVKDHWDADEDEEEPKAETKAKGKPACTPVEESHSMISFNRTTSQGEWRGQGCRQEG
jgi:hypothetical protein